jgi:membrane fusion protein, multidrug efflux system
MSQLIRYFLTFFITITIVSCGGSDKEIKATITEKRTELEQKRKKQTELAAEIKKLEDELALLDTATSKELNAKLVSVTMLNSQEFKHFIEIQGKVISDNISNISPRLGPGQVKAIYVKQGSNVRKGQLLLKLDDAVIRQQIVAARSSLGTIQAQLTSAKDVLNRYENLRKQGIGSEVQLIEFRTKVNLLEAQLTAARENIKIYDEQLRATNVYSDVNGVAEQVNVRVGETFMGMMGAIPQIQIVNNSSLKVEAAIPENYASRVKVGSPVTVILPDANKTYTSTISLSGKMIDANNRSFNIEARIPSDGSSRPNQIAKIQIQDYAVKNTFAVPVNTVQTDEKGKYVFVAVKEGDRMVARKKSVGVGELNGEMIEIRVGLAVGEQLITEGYQNLYEGQVISIVK